MSPRRYAVPLVVAIGFFGTCLRAYALATEHFGNAPVVAGFGFGRDVLDVANLQSRFYRYEINCDPDVNVRNLFDVTVKQIEGGKDDKPARDPAKLRAALEGINAFRETLPAARKK